MTIVFGKIGGEKGEKFLRGEKRKPWDRTLSRKINPIRPSGAFPVWEGGYSLRSRKSTLTATSWPSFPVWEG